MKRSTNVAFLGAGNAGLLYPMRTGSATAGSTDLKWQTAATVGQAFLPTNRHTKMSAPMCR